MDAPERKPPTATSAVDQLRTIEQRRRTSLIEFACAIDVPGKPIDADREEFDKVESALAAHHRLLLEKIERTVNTPQGRAMILMPPGSAKSTYCSVVLPTFLMGREPGYRVILASYGTDLARKHGRRARQIVRARRFQEIFNATLARDQTAADAWALTNGSEYMATGIQAGVTGNRANGLIIDDPVKGREDADSKLIRDKTREAYLADLKTRLVPGGWIILIQTRWHEDDLAGSILPVGWAGKSGPILCRDGATWEVLCIPAKCDRADDPLGRQIGEYLWPEWFGRSHWAEFEHEPRTWSALFQQKPTPDTGIFFDADWLKTYERPANFQAWCDTLSIYGASDYATTEGGGDYTVHIVVGIDHEGRMHVLDLWRGQTKPDVWVAVLCNMILRWKPAIWAEETGQIKSAVGPFLDTELLKHQAYVRRMAFPTRVNKEARTQAICGRMAMDGLYLPADAPWVPDFRAELLTFSNGRHDDQVDALALIGQMLNMMRPGKPPAAQRKPRFWHELTMDEAWELLKVKPKGWNDRI